MVRSPQELSEALMKALDFTPEELALNRTGLLSERQWKNHPIRMGTATTAQELIGTILIDKPIWRIDRLLCRALKTEVRSMNGAVKVNQYDLNIGTQTLYTNTLVLKAFEDGANYRLYYVFRPHIYPGHAPAPTLVSGEAL